MPHIRTAERVINQRMIVVMQTLEAPQVRVTAQLDDLTYGERHADMRVLRKAMRCARARGPKDRRSWPCKVTCPSLGAHSPARTRKSVVLPDPLGPRNAVPPARNASVAPRRSQRPSMAKPALWRASVLRTYCRLPHGCVTCAC